MSRLTILFIGIYLTMLCSCGGGNELKSLISNTQEIELKRVDTAGAVLSRITISDKKEIKELLSVVSNAEAPSYKCGHDYEIQCKLNDNNFVAIDLNSDDICSMASFIYKDELMFRYLNKEKLELLKSKLN
ncbi:MAG: hypothetical protein JXQ87_02470 [Bacteroidia bacterium]